MAAQRQIRIVEVMEGGENKKGPFLSLESLEKWGTLFYSTALDRISHKRSDR